MMKSCRLVRGTRAAAAFAITAALGVLVSGTGLAAQTPEGCYAFWQPLGAPHLDLERIRSLAGASDGSSEALFRAGDAVRRQCGAAVEEGSAPWFERLPRLSLLPVASIAQVNTGYPRHQRDGLRWAGKGLSSAVTGGVQAVWGPFSAAFAPVVATLANDSFAIIPITTPGLSSYGSYYHVGSIDLPQRFGNRGARWEHAGQSYLRVDALGAALGVSTETLRWGPSRRNPLLMSGAAPGFFHVFVGTSRPVDVGVGRLEVEAIWGALHESEFFDTRSDNDDRLLAGLVVAFSPDATGLTLGLTRVYSRNLPPGGLGFVEMAFGPYTGVRENPTGGAAVDNQLFSGFLRWAFPEVGFEVYGEYARDDHWEDFEDLLMEPDHSRAYTIGFQQVLETSGGAVVRLAGEVTNLNTSPTWQSGRPMVQFYTHSQLRQGHTHMGQPLGAPIGTGSDAQYFAGDYLGGRWMAGVYLERVRHDNDVYYLHHAYPYTYSSHDVELMLGVRGAFRLRDFQILGDVGRARRRNRGFVNLLDGGATPSPVTNLSLTLGLAWSPDTARSVP